MRLQGLEEIHLLGLATRPSTETDQPEDACGRRGDHGIARMFGKMGAAGGKRLHGLALDRQAKRIDVALLARRSALGKRQRKLGIEGDGALEVRLVVMGGRQDAVASGDVGIAGGLRRGGDGKPVSVGQHQRPSWCGPMLTDNGAKIDVGVPMSECPSAALLCPRSSVVGPREVWCTVS